MSFSYPYKKPYILWPHNSTGTWLISAVISHNVNRNNSTYICSFFQNVRLDFITFLL